MCRSHLHASMSITYILEKRDMVRGRERVGRKHEEAEREIKRQPGEREIDRLREEDREIQEGGEREGLTWSKRRCEAREKRDDI